MVAPFRLLLLYLVTIRRVIIISSPTAEIIVQTSGMIRDEVIEMADKIEEARSRRQALWRENLT